MSDDRDQSGGNDGHDAASDGGDDPHGPAGDAPPAAATAEFGVPGMDCPSCAGKVERSVRSLDGIRTIDARPTAGRLSVGYDADRTSPDAIAGRIEAAGYEVADRDDRDDRAPGDRTATLRVPEMDCPSCAGKVENALDGVAGVTVVDTRPTAGTVVVDDDGRGTIDAVVAAVEGAGYPVEGVSVAGEDGGPGAGPTRASVLASGRARRTGVGAVLLAAGLLVEWVFHGIDAVLLAAAGVAFTTADVLFLGAAAVGGATILRNGYYSARNRSLDIDFLMSVAVLSAVAASLLAPGTSLYFEAATLSVLFSVAELLERYAMDRTRNSLRELMDLSPETATLRRGGDGEEVTVPVEEIAVGDTAVVRPGEKIPADGTVREGAGAVDQSPVTGESVPVDKQSGDEVYAGTVNEEGYLEIEVTAAAGDDTLSRVIDLVEAAGAKGTEREQFIERFAGYYTPAMVALAVLVATVPPLALGAPPVRWFVYGITLLVLACPCAFVISTPVSVVSGITAAARNGVLVRGGASLEAMGAVEAVAFDKTGTLTTGELAVTDVIPLGDRTEAEVLRCARGVERRSEHPIGEAIVAHADRVLPEGPGVEGDDLRRDGGVATDREPDAGPDPAAPRVGHRGTAAGGTVTDFESLTGKGVRASLDGTPHYAGKPGLFRELSVDLEHVHVVGDSEGALSAEVRDRCDRQGCLNLVEDAIPRLQAEGKTVVLVGSEDELEGLVAVADEVRPAARHTVERLRDLGLAVVMLTGDNEGTARAVADAVGVDDYRAGLLPEDKVEAVEALEAEYGGVDESRSWARRTSSGGVAMVGDGINDAPALATATVGIAMGAAGTDAALETADVALMGDDLSRVPYVYDLARSTNGVIRQNVWTSLAAKALLAAGVPFGLVPIWAAVLVGDAGMTTAVTANALRLGRLSPEE